MLCTYDEGNNEGVWFKKSANISAGLWITSKVGYGKDVKFTENLTDFVCDWSYPSQKFNVIITELLRKYLRNIYVILRLEWKRFFT